MEKIKILGWEVNDIANLLFDVQNRSGRLREVFSAFASTNNRKSDSVRNFFYKFLAYAQKNEVIKDIFVEKGVDFSKLKSHFSEEQTKQLIKNVLSNSKHSVRKTCFNLANGDEKNMIRFQNKYRNTVKNKPSLVKEVVGQLDKPNIEVMPFSGTIMKKTDIEALFWGLVRLVRRQTEQEEKMKVRKELEFANNKLTNLTIDSKKKELLIGELKKQNAFLRERIKEIENSAQISEQNSLNHLMMINSFVESKNLTKLRAFLKEIALKTNENKN